MSRRAPSRRNSASGRSEHPYEGRTTALEHTFAGPDTTLSVGLKRRPLYLSNTQTPHSHAPCRPAPPTVKRSADAPPRRRSPRSPHRSPRSRPDAAAARPPATAHACPGSPDTAPAGFRGSPARAATEVEPSDPRRRGYSRRGRRRGLGGAPAPTGTSRTSMGPRVRPASAHHVQARRPTEVWITTTHALGDALSPELEAIAAGLLMTGSRRRLDRIYPLKRPRSDVWPRPRAPRSPQARH